MQTINELKIQYADFISAQIEKGSEVLPTFSQWDQRRRLIWELHTPEKQSFRLTSQALGIVVIAGQGDTESERFHDARCRLARLEAKHAEQNGGKGVVKLPKTERELLIEQIEREAREIERLKQKNQDLERKLHKTE